MALLDIADLSLEFRTRDGIVGALDDVSIAIEQGEIVGVVGESGSGKSVTAFAAIGLLDPAARVTSGSILFNGMDVLKASERTLSHMRGRDVAMVFQNPRASLNPIRTVGRQIADVLARHQTVPAAERRDQVIKALAQVSIPDPPARAEAYPFELSGGMCQRVGIAMAVACAPQLLIADEPTTGLDVTTQAEIMDLIRDLSRAKGMGTMFITHDLRLASDYCDRIVVMHAGQVVESAPTRTLFAAPRHPYSAALMAATPSGTSRLENLPPIRGGIPDLRRQLPPCRFAERCDRCVESCITQPLPHTRFGPHHTVACWRPL